MNLDDDENGLREVKPVNYSKPPRPGDKVYKYNYVYSDIDKEAIIEDLKEGNINLPKKSHMTVEDGYVLYSHSDEPDIYIDEYKCYRKVGTDKNVAELSCFRALSILDGDGYVSFFQRSA